MSESATLKPNQLVSAPSSKSSEMDDLFSGLGLGSYVAKKDTGAIATGLMAQAKPEPVTSPAVPKPAATSDGLSLEDKRRMMQQGEQMQRLSQQPALGGAASTAPMSKPSTGPVDLTASLMQKSLSGMSSSNSPMSMSGSGSHASPMSMSGSQSMGSFQSASMGPATSTNWGGFASAAPAPPMSMPQQQQQQGQRPKPDLSAFDSLLSMPSSQKSAPMAQQQAQARPMMGSGMGMGMLSPHQPQQQQQPQAAAKPLSSNDINDLLG